MQALEQRTVTERIQGDWLVGSDTVRTIDALRAVGATPRFVGGCVRDSLLGRRVRDIDIAVDTPPEETIAALEAAQIKVVPTGLSHGTVTAVGRLRSFEITTLRVDSATDGRRASVEFTADWLLDAQRRDFTMNALYADPDGTVFDPLEQGIADLSARRVRFIGSAMDRIGEDYLRILRLFRFHAWYGEGEMEPDALVACAGMASGMAGLSRERIGSELLKLLSAPQPFVAVQAMIDTGVMAQIMPTARTDAPPMAALASLEKRFGFTPEPLRRLAMLSWGSDPAEIAGLLRLSKEQRRGLAVRSKLSYVVEDAETARRVGYERGKEAGYDLLLLTSAETGAEPPLRLLGQIVDGSKNVLPIEANDLLNFAEAGPAIGEALRRAEQTWIESDFTLDRATLLDEAKRVI